MRIPRLRFEELVLQAESEVLASLSARLRAEAEEIVIEVEARPSPEEAAAAGLSRGETLYGMYSGVPLVERRADYVSLRPDRITLYHEPLQSSGRTEVEVRAQIRGTLIHELAHHFGLTDRELEERGHG